jgi:hypothetical protein
VHSSTEPDPAQLLLALAAILSAAGSIFSWCLYFTLYWPYRNLFDGEGRYFDADSMVVHRQQAGLAIVPALAFLLLAILFAIGWRARRARQQRMIVR